MTADNTIIQPLFIQEAIRARKRRKMTTTLLMMKTTAALMVVLAAMVIPVAAWGARGRAGELLGVYRHCYRGHFVAPKHVLGCCPGCGSAPGPERPQMAVWKTG